jgi:hypothetical protein
LERKNKIMTRFLLAAALTLLLCGCSTVNTHISPYLGMAGYAATNPASVQILTAEPTDRAHQRLGEIFLDISGSPSREKLEKKLKAAAANLGANAVFIVYDQTHVFPVVYVGYWGPSVSQDLTRGIVAVAIRYK